MRIVLISLLFQFIAPAFVVTVGAGTVEDANFTCSYHTEHTSLILPLLLKEKDETENESEDLHSSYTSLIDFSDHVSVLAESHDIRIQSISTEDHFDHHPPLFTLYGVFLI